MSDIIVAGDNGTNAVITTAPAIEVVVGGALIGPPGVAGANGAPGATGAQGVQGVTGPQGIQGPKGDKGTFPYFNVQDYGAAGNGVHDDTTSIQAAIVDAAIIGGTVFFPSGTYLITAALVMYTAVSLLGVGSEATIITQSSTAVGALVGTDIASVTIDGILFDGPGSGTANGIDFGWSLAGNLPFLHFIDVWVRQFGGHGIALETPIVSHFDRVIVQDNGKNGFDFYHAGTSCTFTSCWARTNAQAGYHFFESVYMNLSGCASDNNGINYLVESAQSIGFYSCGSEGALTNGGLYNGYGFKIANSSVIDLNACWITDNRNVGVWITDGSQEVKINVADNSPNGTAVNFIKTDVSTNSTIYELHNTTANSLSPGTCNIMNDGALGVLVKDLYVKSGSGTLHLSANTDATEFNLSVDTTGVLSLFGAGGTVLNVQLLDGYLQLTPLTATTVPYLDANKRFVSSAITPTQLGYLSPATGNTGTGALVFGTAPTVSSLTVNTLLTANTELDLVGTSGTLRFTAATDGADYNIFHASGNKTLALYGSSSAVLNLQLLDGYLEIDALTLSTVPYLDANKRLASSAVTPTELGYVSGVTSGIQAQLNALTAGAGIERIVSSVATNTTAGAVALKDYVYICTTTMTLTLPTAVGNNNMYTIKSNDATHTITVATTSAQTIDGASTVSLAVQYQSISVVSNGTNWMAV